MKRAVRFLAMNLLIGYLLTCPVGAKLFLDVDETAEYAKAVDYVSEEGFIVGDSNGNFNPDQTVTRAQMAVILCRVLGETENLNSADKFSDVPVSYWANAYISRAVELCIVNGYGNGKFGPADNVTYEQGIAMIVRTVGGDVEAAESGGYPDGFLAVAEKYGLIKGVTAKSGEPLTRADIATIIYNCMA